jgi:hypothetical protein
MNTKVLQKTKGIMFMVHGSILQKYLCCLQLIPNVFFRFGTDGPKWDAPKSIG